MSSVIQASRPERTTARKKQLTTNKIKIIIADDHRLIRDGIRSSIAESSDISLVGEATDGMQALQLIEALSPDVAILDISMPKYTGLELAEIIRSKASATKTLILSMHDGAEYINESMQCGANGYLLKDSDSDDLLDAIRTVAQGFKYYNQDVSDIIIKCYISKNKAEEANNGHEKRMPVTKREKEILKGVVKGLTSKQIAHNLSINVRTVQTHRANILAKLRLKNTTELVLFALKNKL